jgi:hypothetical protein
MLKLFGTAAALIVFWNGFLSFAVAHSPYFGQKESISHPSFGNVEFAVLYGDGIFFADPSQVVVFDSEGYLLGATPQSEALLIRCDRSHGSPTCQVYDALSGLVFEPDHEQWVRSRKIEEAGRPARDAYPEYMDIEYGFTQRPATFSEKISFEAVAIFNAPAATLLSVLWWSLAWLFVVRLVWAWKRKGWSILPIRIRSVTFGILSILAFVVMCILALYGWLQQPYSSYYFFFVFFAGALIAAVLTRPKEAVEKN